MARRTIYISEDDKVAEILACCALAQKVMEKYLGPDFLKRDDLDKISLRTALILCRQRIYPILIELNRICV